MEKSCRDEHAFSLIRVCGCMWKNSLKQKNNGKSRYLNFDDGNDPSKHKNMLF